MCMDGGQEFLKRLRFTGAVLLQAVRLLPRHHRVFEAEARQKEGGDKIARSPAVQRRDPCSINHDSLLFPDTIEH